MGILDNIERGLERAVNGAFAKTFKSGLQPVEIAAGLKAELDTRAQVISRDRILVPNHLTVRLSPDDLTRLGGTGGPLQGELSEILTAHARKQGYAFAGPLLIDLVPDTALSTGMSDVSSATVSADVTWIPVLDVGDKRYPLTKPRTIIGRSSESDVVLSDTGASKRHAVILWDAKTATARVQDLGSTNGTSVNGVKIAVADLPPDTTIRIGRTPLTYRLAPQTGGDE